MNLILVLSALINGVAQKPAELPPLTPQQQDKVRTLATRTQAEAKKLKERLEKRQNELTLLYSDYELDLKKVEAAETELIEIQKLMLENYRTMQVELRKIVSEERFLILRKRLDLMLQQGKPSPVPSEKPVRK